MLGSHAGGRASQAQAVRARNRRLATEGVFPARACRAPLSSLLVRPSTPPLPTHAPAPTALPPRSRLEAKLLTPRPRRQRLSRLEAQLLEAHSLLFRVCSNLVFWAPAAAPGSNRVEAGAAISNKQESQKRVRLALRSARGKCASTSRNQQAICIEGWCCDQATQPWAGQGAASEVSRC